MSDPKKFDYFLLRYVPNVVREEFVNIGLIMTEIGGDGGGFAGVHFTRRLASGEVFGAKYRCRRAGSPGKGNRATIEGCRTTSARAPRDDGFVFEYSADFANMAVRY